jgi:hypothetical protein
MRLPRSYRTWGWVSSTQSCERTRQDTLELRQAASISINGHQICDWNTSAPTSADWSWYMTIYTELENIEETYPPPLGKGNLDEYLRACLSIGDDRYSDSRPSTCK